MKNTINIFLIILCPLTSIAQYYIKGEVKDEKGISLQNASIRLSSTGYVYYSGSGGSFGIVTNKKTDTLTIWLDGYEKIQKATEAGLFITVNLKKAPLPAGKKLSSRTTDLTRAYQEQWFTGDETYASIIENQFIDAAHYPGTSIALSTDRASYSNIRRYINQNTIVPPDAVRTEEMVNYFNINYVPPPDNKVFDINGILTGCPWNQKNQLLFFRITSKELNTDTMPPGHFIFLIDVSASMDMPNRLPLIKEALKTLVKNIRAKDSVSIVVYGGTTGIALATTGGNEKDRIIKTIDSLHASGTTPGASGIMLAYGLAQNHYIKGGNNRIILATDGDFNVGLKSEEDLKILVSKQSQSGVYLTCLGMGMGNYKDSKIQTLAQWGKGNFAYLDSYAEAEKVLLEEFTQTLFSVADNVALSVKFNPENAKEYRLLGFDNKVGAIKDTSSILEGGTIGPAFTSWIVFEIVPVVKNISAAERNDIFQDVNLNLKYRLPTGKSIINEDRTYKIGFIPFERTDKSLRFSTAVIMFGSMVKKSKFMKGISWNDVLQIASDSFDNNYYSQKEFISLLQKAKIIYSKKRKKEED
ncbi:MAG TPA: von Willebrand factor type A domain-containing protein [Flavisolibacter sp.]|nr:von Willebrand factor type A domain-containing protein [Flavisolibacter sp.]